MGQSAGAHSVQMLCSTRAAQGLIAKAVMSSGAGDDSVLFAGDWVMEHKYPFWTAWMEATGASTLAQLRALPPQTLLGAMGKQFATQGFGTVMANMGPVWDTALFPDEGFTLPIPYLVGGNTQDMKPEMTADALRWCQKQSADSYAWCFARQLPGDDKGAWHSADLWYWFGTLTNSWRPFNDGDRALSGAMVSYLTHFAASGNPNGAGLPVWETARHSGQVLRLDVPAPAMAGLGKEAKANVFGW